MKAFFLLSSLLVGLSLAADTYQLVWSDEFNGNSLDLSKWQYEINCDGGGNNELQCYTKNANNLKVANGLLTITAVPQAYNGKQYTSARINTRNSVSWTYGKFEARAKIPRGEYLWPALWMMPRDSSYGGWAASGEIDIFEGRGQYPNQYQSTLHYGGSWPNNVYRGSGERNHPQDLSADFHTYSVTWTPTSMSFAVDDVTFYTRALTDNFYSGRGANPYTKAGQPFDKPFYYIINMAVGGGFFGANANALTGAMARNWANPNFQIDYVRAYQLSSNTVIVNPVPVPSTVKSTTTSAQPQATQSTGVSTAKSSAASTVVSTAATSGIVSREWSAGSTFVYSKSQGAQTSASPPAQTNSNACPNGCGANNCCNDVRLGGVCFNTNTHHCVSDSDGLHLCGLGAQFCKQGGCYDASLYNCNNGALAPK
jgi:beta-glucanase (GH16 family)